MSKYTTLHAQLTVVAKHDFKVHHLNVKTGKS